jgi:alpha-ketoglutarate-dependent taurine dioxygenase
MVMRRECSRVMAFGRLNRMSRSLASGASASVRFWSRSHRIRSLQDAPFRSQRPSDLGWNLSPCASKYRVARNPTAEREASTVASQIVDDRITNDDDIDDNSRDDDDSDKYQCGLDKRQIHGDQQEQNTSRPCQTGAAISISPGAHVSISGDGQAVSITITTNHAEGPSGLSGTAYATTTTTYPAPLLWVTDPKWIHPSSGQRLRSLGDYSRDGSAIVGADIVIVQNVNGSTANQHNAEEGLHPPPLRGSMHPRGGIYSRRTRQESDYYQERRLLKLQWKSGEESFFDLEWLMDHSREGRMGRSATTTTTTASPAVGTYRNVTAIGMSSLSRVTKDIAIGAIGHQSARSIPTFDYTQVLNGESLLETMQGIFERGAILIRGAPSSDASDESIVGNLGRMFSGGRLSHGSLYGEVFHVETKSNAENIAYTNVPLPPHQDLTYFESKPFLQLLHCVNDEDGDSDNRIVGGESVLIDAMAAAEELRMLAPELFHILCNYEATFLKEREGACMVSPKPHIVTDPTFGQVVEINWSPPFEGPLQLNPQLPLEEYLRAYQAMECILDDQQRPPTSQEPSSRSSPLPEPLEHTLREYARTYSWELALQRGDVLVFNNQRMLHGRRGFTTLGSSSKRHLMGCYTDAMETTSHYRQLLRERQHGGSCGGDGGFGRRNAGNGCRWM